MQVNRRFKPVACLASTAVLALAAVSVTSTWAQTQLRPPVGSLGSTAKLGVMNTPVASPASGPASSALASPRQTFPTSFQTASPPQAPLSPSPLLAPRSTVATPVQPQSANISGNGHTLPNAFAVPGGRTQTATTPNDPKVQQVKLPQRLQCLTKFALEGLWSGPADIALTCEVQEKWVQTIFGVPNKQLFDVMVAAQKSGFSLWIDYTDSAGSAEGNPKGKMMMVGAQEAYQSVVHVVCLALGNLNSLPVGPRSDQPYPQLTTWCTDGRRVTPVTFASDKNSWKFLLSNVEYGPLAISYQLVKGGRHPKTGVVRPYPIEEIKQINGESLMVGVVDSVLASGYRWCGSDYIGAAATAGCEGRTTLHKAGEAFEAADIKTIYSTFFYGVALEDRTPIPDSKISFKRVYLYYLMPGVVPQEFRNVSKGACRVALYRNVDYINSSRVGVGYSDNPKDPYCRTLFASNTAFWGYSNVRKENKCFSSKAEQTAENKPFNDAQAAQYAKQYTKPPPPTADTCQVLQ